MSKVCLIVGAGAGNGAAIARRFSREGFAIGLVSRDEAKLAAIVASLREAGARVASAAADAGRTEELRAALASLTAALGPADALIYNAAGATMTPLLELSPERLVADVATSVAGALTAAQFVAPAMKACGAGAILITGGGFALEPVPALASLGVGKAGARNLAFSLAKELEPAGIHVATVTICGIVKPGTAFDPDRIADAFWTLQSQPKGAFEREIMIR